jgi:hypothetical protein
MPKIKAPKYRLRQKVYSWQNPTVKREISHIHKAETPGYPHQYKLALYDKDGYSYSSKWMNESSLSLRKTK